MAEEEQTIDSAVETTSESTETKGFDPKAFTTNVDESRVSSNDHKKPIESAVTTTEATDDKGGDEDHLSDEMTWDILAKEETPAETTAQTTTTTADAVVTQETKAPVIADFSAFAKEAGIEAKDETEFLSKFKEQQKELNDLKSLALGGVTSKEIESVSSLLKLSNEDLVRHDYKLQGLDENIINEAVDKLKDNGMLDVEAAKVKATINKYINNKKIEKINSDKQAQVQAEQANQANLKAIREQMNKTDTLFGFKIATSENMQKARDEHYNYLTSGKFLDEITANPEAAIEASFLWKNKGVILKAMTNKAKSQGKQEVLKSLQNTQLPDTGRVHVAGNEEKGFDPNKFTEGVRTGS